jgi:hypothetical protein
MIHDYASLLLVIGAFAAVWALSRWPVWRRCRCGTQYCTGCGTKRSK